MSSSNSNERSTKVILINYTEDQLKRSDVKIISGCFQEDSLPPENIHPKDKGQWIGISPITDKTAGSVNYESSHGLAGFYWANYNDKTLYNHSCTNGYKCYIQSKNGTNAELTFIVGNI